MTDQPTIQQALAAVMADVRKVAKTGTNAAQHFNFRGIDAVLNHVGPALRDHRVVIRPDVSELRYERVVVGDRKAAVQVLAFVTYEFIGPAGDRIAANVVGEAIDYGDKGVSKAMSVALRTALIQTLALPTGDPDPDTQTYQRTAEPATQPRRQRTGRDEILANSGPTKPSAYSIEGNRPAGGDKPVTKAQLAKLHACMTDYGIGGHRDLGLAYITETIGRTVESTKDLTVAEASKVIDRLVNELEKGTDAPVEPDPTRDDEWKAQS